MIRIFLQLFSVLLGVVFLFVAGQTDPVMAEGPSSSATMEITYQDDLISAEFVDVPLIDILQQLKQKFGFKGHFHGDLTEQITLSFSSIPLEKCLRLLTASHSLSVATRQTAKMPEQDEGKQIAEIWVFSRSSTSKTVNITPAAPLRPLPGSDDNTTSASEDMLEQVENAEQESISSEQELIEQNAEEPSRRQTIKNLAAIGDSDSVIAMAEFSRDADKEVRKLTVNGISSIESEESTRVLGQVLLDEPDPEIRKIALSALGQRKDNPVARVFLEGALNDADEEVKTLADQLLAQ